MVKDRVSEGIDKGYAEVISLQDDSGQKVTVGGVKMEMNSFLMIVLRLTWPSMENQRMNTSVDSSMRR